MSLLIRKQGLLDTIQDAGRYGYQHLGINTSGAMDSTAMKTANALVGNSLDEPVLEMHFPAAEVEFEMAALIAISGADCTAEINGEALPMLHPVMIQKGSVLRFQKNQTGARVYLAISGGYISSTWLNSNSTNLKVKAGGYQGRALQKNDRLLLALNEYDSFHFNDKSFIALPWSANLSGFYAAAAIQFIPGAEYHYLNGVSAKRFENISFTILPQSDRMGYRLRGESLVLHPPGEIISSAVTKGTIQLLPDGQLIILLADHQTSGGYPRIGHVISSHIASLAQMRAGEKIEFKQTNLPDAEEQLLKQQKNLQLLQNACNFRLQAYFKNQ